MVTKAQTIHTLPTNGPGLYEFTKDAAQIAQKTDRGLLTILVQHTSCSLVIQENADPSARADLETYFEKLAPRASHPSMSWLTHTLEGDDDMPAHLRAALTQTCLTLPVGNGRLLLGTWQGIFLFEHRDRPHQRNIVLHLSD